MHMLLFVHPAWCPEREEVSNPLKPVKAERVKHKVINDRRAHVIQQTSLEFLPPP